MARSLVALAPLSSPGGGEGGIWSGGRQELQHIAGVIPAGDTSPPTAGVDLSVLRGSRPTSIRDTGGLNAVEHRVELRITHMKGIVMTLKPVAIIEVEC